MSVPDETAPEKTAEMPGTGGGPPGAGGGDGGGDGGGGDESGDGSPGRPRWLWPAVLAGAVVVVIAGMVGIFGLTGDSDSEGPEPATTTAPSTTTSSEPEEPTPTSAPSTTEPATTAADATPPPETDLVNGRHPVYLNDVDSQGGTIEFDVIQFLGGEEAADAYYEDNPDAPPGGPPNDYYIVNENPRLRRLPVTSDVEVTVLDWENSYTPRTIPFDGLASHIDNSPVPREDDGTWPIPVWLTVDDGQITEVEEQFIP